MKIKITCKELKSRFKVINAGNGNLQNLLVYSTPTYYITRVEGWACDVYIFGDVAICNGYDCPTKYIGYEACKKHDNKAAALLEKMRNNYTYWSYNRVNGFLNKYINDFISEVIR